MKEVITFIAVMIFTVTVAFGHGDMKHSELGTQILKTESHGIKVRAWLNDMESAMKLVAKDSSVKMDMSKMDPDLTHHFSALISGDNNVGKIKGAVLKIRSKDLVKEYSLVSMRGHYGADISLKEKDSYKAELVVNTERAGQRSISFTIKD